MRPVRSHFLNLSIVDPQAFGVERVEQAQIEQELLFGRLKPVSTGYNRELRCMDGTRQSLLDEVIGWVPNKSGQENVLRTVLRLTWNRKNVVRPFDLCKPSRVKLQLYTHHD